MMRRARDEEEEDERVVYYDLDAGSHSRDLLLSPDAASAPAQPRVVSASAPNAAAEAGDDSEDEAEGKEEQENPFATLIQQHKAVKPPEARAISTGGRASGGRLNSLLHTVGAVPKEIAERRAGCRVNRSNGNTAGRSILKQSQQQNSFIARAGTKKKLSFEAAGSRPARWNTQKPSHADTNNRRKSLSAIQQKRRSQLEAASAKRFDICLTPSAPKVTTGRTSKSDGAVAKIRGSIGDILRKAIRKGNRDLTILRSRGQHLLAQLSNESMTGTTGAVESIQDRAYIVVCIMQRCVSTPQFASYECNVNEVSVKMEKTTAEKLSKNVILEAVFRPQTVEHLRLSPGMLVKIYEPLHVVAERMVAGSTSTPKWFLLNTQLAEVFDDSSAFSKNP
ncbi:unnamed protein product [Phytophthora fragariaefolia]|uniref:Unnamed protein product n=1 Tax=Phytophthora fragariaefolia TaxID=1490495 RepID=A0A9W6YLV9_9STRA|nr:unnamed protein product [Phytophthora fragariaefolia]